MTRLRAHCLAAMVVLVLVSAGCSGSAGGNGGSGNGGGNGGNGGTGGGNGGDVPAGGGGDLSKVDSCSLLTPAEIQQAVAKPFKAGVNQDSDIVKQCEWDQQGDAQVTVGLTVRQFDSQDWQIVGAFPKAATVSGLGEAAYKNSPLDGDLSVKYHGYEIDMGIVNFSTETKDQIDQASLDLMKIVLTRL